MINAMLCLIIPCASIAAGIASHIGLGNTNNTATSAAVDNAVKSCQISYANNADMFKTCIANSLQSTAVTQATNGVQTPVPTVATPAPALSPQVGTAVSATVGQPPVTATAAPSPPPPANAPVPKPGDPIRPGQQ